MSIAENIALVRANIAPDGTVTESILYIDRPLQAAQLRIIKARLKADGSLQPESQEVGVSVTLDWKQGGTYEPEL